ncbi:hypothetical protein AXG93_2520s1120 [Marchantia polymorpha subsp. ruderalis]|uniref:Uncharacterized protein n=1 Tax=Marchantia polymorpha subsp. ruderalis TaxID=1480154 RepID=A0A176W609_MARPO|nr:hypothetical protein AXG93_2520s1120 [Marchantia polymorpha subsp. ruderalis]
MISPAEGPCEGARGRGLNKRAASSIRVIRELRGRVLHECKFHRVSSGVVVLLRLEKSSSRSYASVEVGYGEHTCIGSPYKANVPILIERLLCDLQTSPPVSSASSVSSTKEKVAFRRVIREDLEVAVYVVAYGIVHTISQQKHLLLTYPAISKHTSPFGTLMSDIYVDRNKGSGLKI